MALIDVQDSSQAFFTTYARGEQRVSLVGDLHPTYHGSVVKALASSRAAIPSIMLHINALSQRGPSQLDRLPQLRDFQVRVHSVTAVTPTMTWLVLHAPCSQRVLPGTLYRLRPGYADSWMQSSDSVAYSLAIMIHRNKRFLFFSITGHTGISIGFCWTDYWLYGTNWCRNLKSEND